jgi:CIC family chloride channel protein
MRRNFASPQPNIPGRGILAGYSPRFWALVLTIGSLTGLAAAGFILLLKAVERLSWGRPEADFLAAVRAASPARHVLVLVLAGVIAAAGTFLIRRVGGSGGGEISEALWFGRARLELIPSLVRGVLSIVTVGMGVSLGREGAPQLAGAAIAGELCERSDGRISDAQRRLLVASGAGAGFAAVYNVPLGGALFALEVLLGSLALPLVLPALLMSIVATAVGWIVISTGPEFSTGSFHVVGAQIVWAALVGPLAALVAVAWVRLIELANRHRPSRRAWRLLAPIVIFGALGALAIRYPQLLGNGIDLAQLAFAGSLSVGLLAVLLVLKPIVTGSCLASGSPGGLFMPTLTLGVLFGALLGHAWTGLWPGSPIGSYALIGGGAVLAAAMQGPLAASVLMLELTHSGGSLTVPLLLAVAEATVLARLLNAPSIYAARLARPRAALAPHDEPA